jgi:hypothetical protein
VPSSRSTSGLKRPGKIAVKVINDHGDEVVEGFQP